LPVGRFGMIRLRRAPGSQSSPERAIGTSRSTSSTPIRRRLAGWEVDQMRWVPIRLINRGTYEIEVEGPINARLGWPFWPLRRSVDVASSSNRKIPCAGTTWYFVRLRKTEGWRLGWAHLRVRWNADEGRVRYRGWVKLRPGLPPRD
jgi:hypothetical protein